MSVAAVTSGPGARRRDVPRELERKMAELERGAGERFLCPRDQWGDGPWSSEPDRKFWQAPRGYRLLMLRSPSGAWCGYVGLPPGHVFYGADYGALDVDVHGGLTFAGPADRLRFAAPPAYQKLWFLGFDCAHFGDYSPALEALSGQLDPEGLERGSKIIAAARSAGLLTERYRTLEEVSEMVEELAADLLQKNWQSQNGARVAGARPWLERWPEWLSIETVFGEVYAICHFHWFEETIGDRRRRKLLAAMAAESLRA